MLKCSTGYGGSCGGGDCGCDEGAVAAAAEGEVAPLALAPADLFARREEGLTPAPPDGPGPAPASRLEALPLPLLLFAAVEVEGVEAEDALCLESSESVAEEEEESCCLLLELLGRRSFSLPLAVSSFISLISAISRSRGAEAEAEAEVEAESASVRRVSISDKESEGMDGATSTLAFVL